jgi:hypothetical protein
MYRSKTETEKWKLNAGNGTSKPNPCVICLPPPSPEDGNRSVSKTFCSIEYRMMGKVHKTSNSKCSENTHMIFGLITRQ